MTMLQLFSYVQEADNNYKKVFFLDDTNQISDWPGVRLRFCSIWVNRYNGAVATIYLYGSLHNDPYTPNGYILSDINNNIMISRLANHADCLTTSNVAMRYCVTLPTVEYGNYYFSLYGLKDRTKYRVANAYIVGDSTATDLASYIQFETYNDGLILALSSSAPHTGAGKCLNIVLAYA